MYKFIFDVGVVVLSLVVILFASVLVWITSALKSDAQNRKVSVVSPRMTAVEVDEKTRKIFANPRMSSFGNIPRGYEGIDN